MATTEESTTDEVLDHHLDAFGECDLDAVMDDYASDAVMIADGDVVEGADEIAALFDTLFDEFDDPDVEFSLNERVVHDDYAYIKWEAETPETVYDFATDTFVVRDGEIVAQTLATVSEPKS